MGNLRVGVRKGRSVEVECPRRPGPSGGRRSVAPPAVFRCLVFLDVLHRRRGERKHQPGVVGGVAVDLVRDRPANGKVERVRRQQGVVLVGEGLGVRQLDRSL